MTYSDYEVRTTNSILRKENVHRNLLKIMTPLVNHQPFWDFSSFNSRYKFQKRRNKPLQRRSLEPNTSNRSLLKAFQVNDEVNQVQTFIKDISFPVDESTSEDDFQSAEEMLLKFLTENHCSNHNDMICNICSCNKTTEQLIKCAGTCDGYLHRKCFDNWSPHRLDNRDADGESTDILICQYCSIEWKSFCFVCKTVENSSQSAMVNCKIANCWRRYHVKCLENWPQAKWNDPDGDSHFICPAHECHQCAMNATMDMDTDAKLTNCIKCPTTLHNDAKCIHAGTVVLSDANHICIKHREIRPTISNLDYCYICKMGRCRHFAHHKFHFQLFSTDFSSYFIFTFRL